MGSAALPAGVRVRPYLVTQLLADLGASPCELDGRTVAKIKKSFPVPVEQEIIWAEVELGTRSHGLVLTDAGVFLKDGPADDDDEDEDGGSGSRRLPRGAEGTRQAEVSGVEYEGLGYFYIRWESFDPDRLSHVEGAPTLDGRPLLDGRVFHDFAMACVRANNRRVRMRNSARRTLRGTDLLPKGAPARSVCRASAAATAAWCFDEEDGCWRFLDEKGTPRAVEVPADQYDAVLQRVRRRVAEGYVPEFAEAGLDDGTGAYADLAAALVRCGWYTRTQAVNLAATGRVPGVELRARTGSVVCTGAVPLGAALARWLRARATLGRGVLEGGAGREGEVQAGVGEVLAVGARAQIESGLSADQLKTRQMGQVIATNAASQASYAVGATASRVLLSAVGVASGPLAMAAGLFLGNACGKAGMEAVSMVRDLFVEPKAHIYERLFSGVLSNLAFEHALTAAEQSLLAELMARADPALFQQLGARLAESRSQEADLRAVLTPMVLAVRRA